MELDEIIQMISGESGLEIKELQERILEKQNELGGLVSPEGAAHIVANEIGINLVKDMPSAPVLKIENIIPGMNSVDVIGRVSRIFPVREFDKKDGSKGMVCNIILIDNTGSVKLVLWDGDVALVQDKTVSEGDILRIRGGYSKEGLGGRPEIHAGMRSRITPNPRNVDDADFPHVENRGKKISELTEDDASVDVLFKVLRIYETREFNRKDGTKGKVVNLIIGDETGNAKLVLWDDNAELVERSLIKEGDTIKVLKGYVKSKGEDGERSGGLEINVGRYGELVLKPEERLKDVKLNKSNAERKYIKDLEEGDVAAVRGALVDIYDNVRVFEKAGRMGMVVNAVIDDGTSNIRAVFYDRMAEMLMDIPLEKILGGKVQDDISERIIELLGKEILVQARVKYSDFSGQNELVIQDINLNPDPRRVAENLIEEANASKKYEV